MTKSLSDKPAKVLVVDDSPTVLRVVEGVLTQAGYDVACLESGRDIIAVARKLSPDLIFVDFAMPDISGYSVCQALGSAADLESIPIVLMNTRGDAVGERFIDELGIVDHITKPFAPEALLAVTEHTLHKAKVDGDKPRRRPALPLAIAPQVPKPVGADQVAAAIAALASRLAARADGQGVIPDLAARLERALADANLDGALAAIVFGGRTALRGDLGCVPIAEVMQILALQRQSGFLHIRDRDAQISIAFARGSVRMVTAQNLSPELLLGSILVQEKRIHPEELEQLLTNRRGTSHRLGSQVVKLGYISQQELHAALKRQSSELVYDLLRWTAGSFWFEPESALPVDVSEFNLDLTMDELLMEGFRRVDEWGLIESVIPSFDGVPVRTALGLEHVGSEGLTGDEQLILSAVDGKRSVKEIVRHVGAGSFEVARLLYRLVSSRIVAMQRSASERG